MALGGQKGSALHRELPSGFLVLGAHTSRPCCACCPCPWLALVLISPCAVQYGGRRRTWLCPGFSFTARGAGTSPQPGALPPHSPSLQTLQAPWAASPSSWPPGFHSSRHLTKRQESSLRAALPGIPRALGPPRGQDPSLSTASEGAPSRVHRLSQDTWPGASWPGRPWLPWTAGPSVREAHLPAPGLIAPHGSSS